MYLLRVSTKTGYTLLYGYTYFLILTQLLDHKCYNLQYFNSCIFRMNNNLTFSVYPVFVEVYT